MKFKLSTVLGAAAATGMAFVASAQTPSQSSTQAPGTQEQQVTITGCVQREADYRRAQDAGKGGVAGTGLGVGNEFVLVNASMSGTGPTGAPGSTGTAGGTRPITPGAADNRGGTGTATGQRGTEQSGQARPGTGAPGPATSAATTGSGSAYELTGPNEGQLTSYAGRRVEITGKLKAADTSRPGGPTQNAPGSTDLRLRELEVSSVREAPGGTCPTS